MSIKLQQDLQQKHIDFFWSRINKNGIQTKYVESKCWEWLTNATTTPLIRINDKNWLVNHVSYFLHYGSLPDGTHFKRLCHNSDCMNPNHLYHGSFENYQGTETYIFDTTPYYVDKNKEGYIPQIEREFPNQNRTLTRDELIILNKILFENEERICSNCEEIQPLGNYRKHATAGLHSECIGCQDARARKLYYDNHEANIARQRIYNALPSTKERKKKTDAERRYNPETRGKLLEMERASKKRTLVKLKKDPLYSLECSYRRMILFDLAHIKATKDKEAGEYSAFIRGCTLQEFKEWLERSGEFKVEDHGKYLELDHIVPRCLRRTKEDVFALNYYTNFQLLPKAENSKKSDRLPYRAELPPEIHPDVLAIYERAVHELGEIDENEIEKYFYTRKPRIINPIPIMDQIFQED